MAASGQRAGAQAPASGAPDRPVPFLGAGMWSGEVSGCEVSEGRTAPPAAYTDGTLMADMSCIAKYVSDPAVRQVLIDKDRDSPGERGSIGTSATRASIVEQLVARGYLERRGAKIVSTPRGRALADAVPPDVLGVDTTARWWLLIEEVRAGRAEPDALADAVAAGFAAHRDGGAYEGSEFPDEPGSAVIGSCPLCGADVVLRSKGAHCSNRSCRRGPDGKWVETGSCSFWLYKWSGKVFTERQLAALLSGRTVKSSAFKSAKTGKRFGAVVRLSGEGRVEVVEFDNSSKRRS